MEIGIFIIIYPLDEYCLYLLTKFTVTLFDVGKIPFGNSRFS